uniref:hypothetical protein n=1 Tax=Ningiella ruwaisensis TaxID=2364274 RepID=UPI0010A04B00|nr:hypothetical protein [Ningiella ruwaisensis]
MTKKLLWLGAGEATTPAFNFEEYDHLYLVDIDFNKKTLERFSECDNIDFFKTAVYKDHDNPCSFYKLNNEEFSSLRKPSGLKSVYPNICIEEVIEIHVTGIIKLLSECGLSGNQNTLVIDLPCIFLDILNELVKSEKLVLFKSIYIFAGKIEMFEQGGTYYQASELLKSVFFKLESEDSNDPDFFFSRYVFSQELQKIAQLQKSERAAQEEIEKLRLNVLEKESGALNLQEKLSAALQGLNEIEREIELKDKTISQYEEKFVSLESLLKKLESEIVLLENNNNALVADIERRQKTQEAIEKLNKKLKEENASSSLEKDSLNLQLKELKVLNDNLSNKSSECSKELEETKRKLDDYSRKHDEVYDWFSSRKRQAEVLSLELEQLKNENALLKESLNTSKSMQQLEDRLSALIKKQGEDNIEIANALGKHVTKCAYEQKAAIASTAELQKISALKHLPLNFSEYSMEPSNLSKLSSMVMLNNYDVIIEFGSGLSTCVAAGAIAEKNLMKNGSKALEHIDSVNTDNSESKLLGSLPNYIVSFEHDSKWYKKTAQLLEHLSLDNYVDLCHTPLINAPYTLDTEKSSVFYDCSEKLLEVKRILNGRTCDLLVIIDGPSINKQTSLIRFPALLLILDYLANAKVTVFLNNASGNEEIQLVEEWKREVEKRELSIDCEFIYTPRGLMLMTVQS